MSTSDESKKKNTNSDDSRGDEDLVPAKVHSANSWETADLGDEDRNKKFLRLMGAKKADHHGKFIIGDKDPVHIHSRDRKQTEDIEQELEEQYKHTFEHRITKWSHKGLGFDDDEKKGESAESNQSTENKEDSEKSKVSDSKADDQLEKKRESSDPAKKRESAEPAKKRESTEPAKYLASPPKKPRMMMNFVKSSD